MDGGARRRYVWRRTPEAVGSGQQAVGAEAVERPLPAANCLLPSKPNVRERKSAHGRHRAQIALRQDLRRPCRRPAGRRHLHPLYRPPSGARGHEPAGLRRPAARRPQGAGAGENAGRGGPQRAHVRPPRRHRRPGEPAAGGDLGPERQGFRRRVLQRARHPPGHRARDRPRAGLHAARHHHRLRRQPHLHPRGLRSAGARHRHLARWSTCSPPRR